MAFLFQINYLHCPGIVFAKVVTGILLPQLSKVCFYSTDHCWWFWPLTACFQDEAYGFHEDRSFLTHSVLSWLSNKTSQMLQNCPKALHVGQAPSQRSAGPSELCFPQCPNHCHSGAWAGLSSEGNMWQDWPELQNTGPNKWLIWKCSQST